MTEQSSTRREVTVKEADKGSTQVTPDKDEKAEDGLESRWETLQGAFLEMAAPVTEALDRADRPRVNRPDGVREAQAAYDDARRERELAEADEKGYTSVAAKSELQSARTDVAAAELTAVQAQTKLDQVLRNRQQITESWIAKGSSPESAKQASEALFRNEVRGVQVSSDQAKTAMKRARERLDRVAGVDQPKRAKTLHARVLAKRVEELARLADWKAAKAGDSRPDTDGAAAELSPDDRRLLDILVRVVREAGPPPPADSDPFESLAYLDRFEDALNSARAAAAEILSGRVSRRYARTVDRLLRAQEATDSR